MSSEKLPEITKNSSLRYHAKKSQHVNTVWKHRRLLSGSFKMDCGKVEKCCLKKTNSEVLSVKHRRGIFPAKEERDYQAFVSTQLKNFNL